MELSQLIASPDCYWEGLRAGLDIPPPMTVSRWADKYRMLSKKAAAAPGPYSTDRTPYLREIMDCLSPEDPAREVVVMKGAQVGCSEAGVNWVGYVIHYAPGPTLMVQPTVEIAKRLSKQRIDSMIEDSPVIRELIADRRSRDSGNTMLAKEFPGGTLILTGANSAAGLRSMPIRNLMLDEVDAYPGDVEGEGSPVELAKARTRTFQHTKKIFEISTPTYKGMSQIERSFAESTREYYHVPCPHCCERQVLRWKQIKWTKLPNGELDPESVHYECEHCHEKILEHHKTKMLADGVWIAEAPEKDKRGFHISSLYSPIGWESWVSIVRDWLAAQGNTERLKTFVNTHLGETFELKSEETPEWRSLYDRRENYPIGRVPKRALALTAAADVQKDRIEIQVIGWNRREAWVVDNIILTGDTAAEISEGVWVDLAELVNAEFEHESGTPLMLEKLAIDSGYNTTRVYEFARKFKRRVMAIKGKDTQTVPVAPPKAVDIRKNGKRISRAAKVWSIGTNILKLDVYNRLNAQKPTDEELAAHGYPALYVHFPMLDQEYFEQLTAEKLVEQKTRNGYAKLQWIKTRARNEALDTFCYNVACYWACGMERWPNSKWEALAGMLGTESKPASQKEKRAAADDKPSVPAKTQPSPRKPRPRRQRNQDSIW